MPWVEELGHFYVRCIDKDHAHERCTTLRHGISQACQRSAREFSPAPGESSLVPCPPIDRACLPVTMTAQSGDRGTSREERSPPVRHVPGTPPPRGEGMRPRMRSRWSGHGCGSLSSAHTFPPLPALRASARTQPSC
jgi:hypothetical protein